MRGILPDAVLCFMHPVKTPAAIREAYFEHGVRTFSLDTFEELEKIIDACRGDDGEAPRDLRLCVRLRVSSEYSELSLASKFGCDLIEAPQLLQQARQHCDWLGVCFHVGSQAMTPFAFVQAMDRTRAAGAAWADIDTLHRQILDGLAEGYRKIRNTPHSGSMPRILIFS